MLPEKADRGHPEQLQRQAKLECFCVMNCETCSASAITVAQSATLPLAPSQVMGLTDQAQLLEREKHKSSQSKMLQSFVRGLGKRRKDHKGNSRKNLVSAKSRVL